MKKGKKYWYAIYTKSRAEKKVQQLMLDAGYEVFLPLHKVARKWSDRIKMVEVPLISSYVFVCVSEAEYYDILKTNGVVAYVTFEGKAAKIPEQQIEALKLSTSNNLPIELTNERLKRGEKVMITSGPLMGMEGVILAQASRSAFFIDMRNLGLAFKVTVPEIELEKI